MAHKKERKTERYKEGVRRRRERRGEKERKMARVAICKKNKCYKEKIDLTKYLMKYEQSRNLVKVIGILFIHKLTIFLVNLKNCESSD